MSNSSISNSLLPDSSSLFPIVWIDDPSSGLKILLDTWHAQEIQSHLTALQQEESQICWRAKTRFKTYGVVCALCLNLGTDPPGLNRVPPYAITECGIDPTKSHDANLAVTLRRISINLEKQYREFQSSRGKLRICPDPTVEDVKRSLKAMRRNALQERILFHFNGHGVPKPTRSGEVWVYNDSFNQYIPLSVYELVFWAGYPSCFVFDSSFAGRVLPAFETQQATEERNFRLQYREWEEIRKWQPQDSASHKPVLNTVLVLCACGAEEELPTSAWLPGDLFTACLTIPVPTALKWFISQHLPLMDSLGIDPRMVDFLPQGEGRKTVKGELTWIFTALMDTIAWNVFPPHLFQRCFREDTTMSSLFHNYLLAERIFKSCGRTPCTLPVFPSTWKHPLWDAWDYTVERSLMQLPGLLGHELLQKEGFHKALAVLVSSSPPSIRTIPVEYVESRFFLDQLLGFEMWLDAFPLSSSTGTTTTTTTTLPPTQLPIVLQLVLSKQHRNHALQLLARFLDQHPVWVAHALEVGLFPYVLKTLRTLGGEVDCDVFARKQVVRICVHVVVFFPSLIRELVEFYAFFVNALEEEDMNMVHLACFLLATICDFRVSIKSELLQLNLDHRVAVFLYSSKVKSAEEEEEEEGDVFTLGVEEDTASESSEGGGNKRRSSVNTTTKTPPTLLVLQWSCLLLSRFWHEWAVEEMRPRAYTIAPRLEQLLAGHPSAVVREACAHALNSLFSSNSLSRSNSSSASTSTGSVESSSSTFGFEINLAVRLMAHYKVELSPLVRREILYGLARFCLETSNRHLMTFFYTIRFLQQLELSKAKETLDGLIRELNQLLRGEEEGLAQKYMSIYVDLLGYCMVDPFIACAQTAQILVRRLKVGAQTYFTSKSSFSSTTPRTMQETEDDGPTNNNGGILLDKQVSAEVFLKSNVFERCKMFLARSQVEIEMAQNSSRRIQVEKQIHVALKTSMTWQQKGFGFIGKRPLQHCEFYSSDDLDVFQDEDELEEHVKDPLLRLLSRRLMVAPKPAPAVVSYFTGSFSKPSQQQQHSSGLMPSPALRRQQSLESAVRRFDELPLDVIHSTSSTSLRKSMLNLPSGGLVRQTSGSSLMVRQASTSSGINKFVIASPKNSPRSRQSSASNSFQLKELSLSDATPPLLVLPPSAPLTPPPPRTAEFQSVEKYEAKLQVQSVFHPHSAHLVMVDTHVVSTFEAESVVQPVSRFENHTRNSSNSGKHSSLSSICSLKWLGLHDDPLLSVITDDGHCRIWRNVTSSQPTCASGFSLHSRVSSLSAPMATAYSSQTYSESNVEFLLQAQQLVRGGGGVDSTYITSWDLQRELPSWEVRAEFPVSAIRASADFGHVLVCASSYGQIQILDSRQRTRSSHLISTGPAISALSKMTRNFCFASASRGGEVRVWDARKSLTECTFRFDAQTQVLAFHDQAPLIALERQNTIRVISFDNVEMSVPIKLGKRTPKPSHLSWHPNEIALSVTTAEGVTVHVCPDTKVRGVWTPSSFQPQL